SLHTETLTGAEQVAAGVANFHGDARTVDRLKETGEVQNLVTGAVGCLAGDGERVVSVRMARHDGERRLNDVDDGPEVSRCLRRGVRRDDRLLAEDEQDAVAIHHHDILGTVAVDVADLYVERSLGGGQVEGHAKAGELALRIHQGRHKLDLGGTGQGPG